MQEVRNVVDEYRQAWTEFDRRLRTLQDFPANAAEYEIEPLLFAVEAARARYSEARDRLVATMLRAVSPVAVTRENDIQENGVVENDYSEEARIRGSARLLWELSGKPDGSAEKNWLQAEMLVRSAASGR